MERAKIWKKEQRKKEVGFKETKKNIGNISKHNMKKGENDRLTESHPDRS